MNDLLDWKIINESCSKVILIQIQIKNMNAHFACKTFISLNLLFNLNIAKRQKYIYYFRIYQTFSN